MRLYVDASVLVSFFANDVLTQRADRFLGEDPGIVVLSDFAAAEFASAIARRVRMGYLTKNEARQTFLDFDRWSAGAAELAETTPDDIALAAEWLRRLVLTLRTPDCLNLAIAKRLGASLVTFDAGMLKNAKALGIPVAAI